MGGLRLTPCMRDFDAFIKESELIPHLEMLCLLSPIYKNPLSVRGWIDSYFQMIDCKTFHKVSKKHYLGSLLTIAQLCWIPTHSNGA